MFHPESLTAGFSLVRTDALPAGDQHNRRCGWEHPSLLLSAHRQPRGLAQGQQAWFLCLSPHNGPRRPAPEAIPVRTASLSFCPTSGPRATPRRGAQLRSPSFPGSGRSAAAPAAQPRWRRPRPEGERREEGRWRPHCAGALWSQRQPRAPEPRNGGGWSGELEALWVKPGAALGLGELQEARVDAACNPSRSLWHPLVTPCLCLLMMPQHLFLPCVVQHRTAITTRKAKVCQHHCIYFPLWVTPC